MPEPQRFEAERANVSFNRPNRIGCPDIVFNERRQKACLLPAHAGLERAIRHNANRTSIPWTTSQFLPSLCAQPILLCPMSSLGGATSRPLQPRRRGVDAMIV